MLWGFSSAGRAPALHAGGHRFDPDKLHQITINATISGFFYIIKQKKDSRLSLINCLFSHVIIGSDIQDQGNNKKDSHNCNKCIHMINI